MYSIIIVDDEPLITASLKNYITQLHPELQVEGTFSDGEAALDYLSEHPVDIVVTDILMSGMDGLEMTRRIRKLLPEVVILIISSYSEFEYAQRAISYGVKNYLLKPIDFQEFSDTLHKVTDELDLRNPSVDCEEDDIQLFFIDLLCHLIQDRQTLQERLAETVLPQSDYSGCILSLTLDAATLQQWKYGLETLSTALLNNLRMELSDYKIYYLYKHHSCYFFILLSANGQPDFSAEKLAERITQTMNWQCTLQTASHFLHLEELLSSQNALPEDAQPVSGELQQNAAHSQNAENTDNEDTIMQNALRYIHEHYADDLSREDVARAVYLTPSYFSRIFKKKTNMNFINYLTTVRMEQSKELLKTQMSISDIAVAVGYMHRNRFITNFRQYTGYTPTEYRKEVLLRDTTI